MLGIIGDSNGSKKTQTNETKNFEPKKEKIGDVSTLEDGAAVNEIQSAFQELQKNIENQNK